MELTPIDEQSLARLTDAQLNELVLAHEAVFRGRCRDNITTFAKSVEIPGAPPALTQEQKVWLADRKTRLDRTIKEVEDEVFDGDEAPLYGSKVDVGLHHEMILEAIKSTVEEAPVFGSMANGMDGVVPDGVMIFAPPGCAKPIWEGELVLMADGSRKALADVEIDDWVICESGKPRRVSATHEQGSLKCITITLRSGRTLTCAPDHPVLTAAGYVNAGDIVVDDIVAIMASGKLSSPEASDQLAARCALAGYLIGDGCVSITGVNQWGSDNLSASVTCGDPVVAAHVVAVSEASGFSARIARYEDRPAIDVVRISKGVREWLRDVGLAGLTSRDKFVPDFVWTSGPNGIRSFLGAYFACDGSVYNKRGRNDPVAAVDCVTVSQRLASDLRSLLLRIGVDTHVYERAHRYVRKDGTPTITYRVNMRSQHDVWLMETELNRYWVGEKYERFSRMMTYASRIDQTLLGDAVVAKTDAGKMACRCLTIDVDDEEGSFVAGDIVVHNSTYASVAAPAYLLGLYQDFDIISASYASELAKRFGRRVRHMCRSKDFQDIFETELREDNQAVDQWSLKNNSSYRAVGIMGGITGFRANLFIIDDPVAGREEADSEIIREKTWQAYKDDITTRLKPGGKLCIIQTRWHQDDLSGRILGPNWDGQSGLWEGTDGRIWLVLCLPLVAERADDPLGRRAGEILWHRKDDGTGWFTDRHVELAKAAGERSWNSLQQQRPTAAEGNIIRRDLWKCWPHGNPEPTAEQLANPHAVKPPDVLAVFLTYDTAFEDKEDNDDSAMCAWGYFEKTINVSHRKDEQVKHRHIILLGAWKDKVDAIDLVEVVKSHVKHFEPEVLCVEKRASGIQLVQELRRLRPRHKRGHVIVEAWLPKGVPGTKGKRARAFAAALVMAEGVIWYMPGPKTQEVRKQCAAFRTGDDGTPDDWTDCCTMAIARSRDGFQLDLSTDELDEQEDRDKKAQDIKDGGRRRGYGSMGGKKQPLETDEDRADGGEVKRRLYGRR